MSIHSLFMYTFTGPLIAYLPTWQKMYFYVWTTWQPTRIKENIWPDKVIFRARENIIILSTFQKTVAQTSMCWWMILLLPGLFVCTKHQNILHYRWFSLYGKQDTKKPPKSASMRLPWLGVWGRWIFSVDPQQMGRAKKDCVPCEDQGLRL